MGNVHGIGGPAHRALKLRAAATSVLLSLLFLLVYGSTNWFTAQRPDADVGTWYFSWEQTVIPYVPLLLVPYMSIDLFFFLASFLCRDKRELQVFASRVVFSILIAAAFFLLLPLKLAWPERPRIGGWLGDLVEASCTAPFLMEYPHNLFPSLHVALCMILADLYGRHTRGILRVLSHIWFGLIAISTLLTWQHHLVDVAGGLLLGAFAFHLFREAETRLPVVANFRIGSYYALGAAAILTLAMMVGPWGAFLLWPAANLGLIAAAYFGLGPGVFRKSNGRLCLSTQVVLAPVLLGHYLSLVYYRRHCRAWDRVAPGVLIGRRLTAVEAAVAVQQGVTAVLDLTAECSEVAPFRATTYRNLVILDLTGPTQEQLHEATRFIAEEAAKGTVFVHCKIGYSRSAAVVGAYLLASQQATIVEEIVALLRGVRPSIIIRTEALDSLRTFAMRGHVTIPRHRAYKLAMQSAGH